MTHLVVGGQPGVPSVLSTWPGSAPRSFRDPGGPSTRGPQSRPAPRGNAAALSVGGLASGGDDGASPPQLLINQSQWTPWPASPPGGSLAGARPSISGSEVPGAWGRELCLCPEAAQARVSSSFLPRHREEVEAAPPPLPTFRWGSESRAACLGHPAERGRSRPTGPHPLLHPPTHTLSPPQRLPGRG
uniref:Uncharacterized protein n=1 Tax=Rousettus aegyptiacus TaxID=9407 RepID=A0A7J8DHC3_ROUAE|nr:hypothetical protein HJG63_008478 [Rousettus aegyptiacus]